jgi:superfamily II DNA or RNA helicase
MVKKIKGIHKNYWCLEEKKKKFIPQEHQSQCKKYFINDIMESKYNKGLLLYHKLGSGKTSTSIIIADSLIKSKKIKHVYIFTPGSLRENWINEYCNVSGYNSDTLYKYYTFITYNYSVGDAVDDMDFDNCLIIIDEVHNLINGYKNQSKNPKLIYEKIKNSDCKVICLSGTPIYNNLYEFIILLELLKPQKNSLISFSGKEIKTDQFDFLLKEKENGTIVPKNPTTFKKIFKDVISYYPGIGGEYYPEVIYMKPIQIKMSYGQTIRYLDREYAEEIFSKKPSAKLRGSNPEVFKMLEKMYIMAKKHIMSRSACNFFYPSKILNMTDTSPENDGWICKEMLDKRKMNVLSSKFSVLIYNIIKHPKQKHVLFTFFKEKSGVILLNSILTLMGIKSLIFSGDLNDKERKSILSRFNSVKNRYAQKIDILLVTEAGAEGITIMEARHFHILESNNVSTKIKQAIGRVVRYKSHYDMPKDEQNVKIWRYWSIANIEQPIKIKKKAYDYKTGAEITKEKVFDKTTITIDQILYDKEIKNNYRIDSFLDFIKTTSVTTYNDDSKEIKINNTEPTPIITLSQPTYFKIDEYEIFFNGLASSLFNYVSSDEDDDEDEIYIKESKFKPSDYKAEDMD